jgi:hypothetical protein
VFVVDPAFLSNLFVVESIAPLFPVLANYISAQLSVGLLYSSRRTQERFFFLLLFKTARRKDQRIPYIILHIPSLKSHHARWGRQNYIEGGD